MINSKILIGVALGIIFLGCESKDITPSKMFIKEIIDPSCSKAEFQYENGRLISYKVYFGERLAASMKFTYQGENLKFIDSESDNGLSSTIELFFGDNGLREKEIGTYRVDSGNINVTTINFFYDENGSLKSKYYLFSDSTHLPKEIEFIWANGNIIKKNYFYFDNYGKHFISSDEFSFDNKVNYTNNDMAFVYIDTFQETILSKNNQISGQNTFEYNKNGYPIGYKYTIGNKDFPVYMNYE